jgi:hypothetical protein
MSWKQKVFALSFVLTPIFLTAAALTPQRGDSTGDMWWPTVAVGAWLMSMIDALMYLRGPFADRQGILPKPPGQRTDLEVQKLLLSAFFITICLSLVAIGVSRRPSSQEWRLLFIFAAVFFGHLSGYTHNLIEKTEGERIGVVSEVPKLPGR